MAMKFRERRLGCRLYVDRRSDLDILKKLDVMLTDGLFSNQTELIKRGIELTYEEAYGKMEENHAAHKELDMKKLAEEVAGVLKPEMKKLLAKCEERLAAMEMSALQKPVRPETTMTSASDASCGTTESATDSVESVLSSQTFSFLKGLNDN